MARMIPQAIPFDAPDSERSVFEFLRDGIGTEDWSVVWSYRPPQFDLESGRRREVDFVILIPQRGILCLEVKGGPFNISDGQWYRPSGTESIEPPDRQSERAMHALRTQLREQFSSNNDVMATPMDFGVAFTDWEWPDGIVQPTPVLFDRDDLQDADLFVVRLLDATEGLSNTVAPGRVRPRKPNHGTVERILSLVAPNYALAAGAQLDSINEQVIRLTQEQYMVLDMFAENERCLVKGMAGTGKTMLALEYAKRAAVGNARVGLVCFNLLLGSFLNGQASASPSITAGGFWPEIIRPLVMSSSVADEFIRNEGLAPGESELYEEVYPRFAELALKELGPQFDVLVADEAADLSVSPYLELMDQLLAGGLDDGKWVMFGDFSNQAIFPGTAPVAESAFLTYRPARVNLRVNCRNTLPIAQDTARISGADMLETREIEGTRPKYLFWGDNGELSSLLNSQVHDLLDDGVRIEEIVVLSEHRLEDSGLVAGGTYGGHRLVTYVRGEPTEADDGTPRLKFCSIPSFKGMESEVVILILGRLYEGYEETARPFDRQNARAYAYIGMSRARGALTVLAQESLREELESRLD